MFHKMNMSHIHLCIFCVICLIFISKWDPFRNKSYQRETILNKINRCLFTFLKMSSEHYLLAWVHVQCSSFFLFDWKKKGKKKGNPGIRTHANLHTVFPRYTLSPVGHRGVLFQCEEEPFDISLLYVTKHDQT